MSKIYHVNRFFKPDDPPFKVIFWEQNVVDELHEHDFVELVIVISGHGMHHFAGSDYPITAGDAFVVKEGTVHGYRSTSELKIANVLIDFPRLHALLDDLTQVPGFYALFETEPMLREQTGFERRLTLTPKELVRTVRMLEEIKDLLEERKPGFRFIARNTFFRLIIYIARAYGKTPGKQSAEMVRLSLMTRFIDGNFRQNLSRDEIVAAAHLSPSSGSRIFRRLTGESPIEYLNRVRIMHAAAMLRETGKGVSEIAYASGFRDSNYFSSVFSRFTGESPSAYRRSRPLPEKNGSRA